MSSFSLAPTQDDGLGTELEAEFITLDDIELDCEKESLGKGAFGTVFKGVYFGTEVAVKKMKIPASNDDFRKFLKREVVILKSLRHPHIVQFVGVCKLDESLLLITEYARGGDLHQCLKGNHLFGQWRTKISLCQNIASAMAYLHSKAIIFRDLKAKNVLVNDKKAPTIAKICDFGFARVVTKDKKNNHLTICGTDDWMAPEVILGEPYDEKSDVFSYGILMLEMIIGTRVIKKELKRMPQNCFEMDLEKARTFVPKTCPPKFMDLAVYCCAYEPKDRPDFKSVVMAANKILADPLTVDLPRDQLTPSSDYESGGLDVSSNSLTSLSTNSSQSSSGGGGSSVSSPSPTSSSTPTKSSSSSSTRAPASPTSPTTPTTPTSTSTDDVKSPSKTFLNNVADQFAAFFYGYGSNSGK